MCKYLINVRKLFTKFLVKISQNCNSDKLLSPNFNKNHERKVNSNNVITFDYKFEFI